ncbi:MGMT family protein [Sphingomonas sp. Leaf17]|uniref:MGMT family protein n=1 Tax=Sphingomonas sp. Leaf17 TaxID=1735683 RepID=UPI001F34ABBC|nr:MGMT family protein [Sphingomonas sp. Leaf17]
MPPIAPRSQRPLDRSCQPDAGAHQPVADGRRQFSAIPPGSRWWRPCARNPCPIVIPCHRIVGTSGALGPYSAGAGPAITAWRLRHEHRY